MIHSTHLTPRRTDRCDTENVPQVTSLYIVGPIVAFCAVGVLALVLRWTFDSDLARKQARIFSGTDDYGLLSVAGVVENDTAARAMQELLREAGIRSTIAVDPDGRRRVLVFESEVEAARRLVGGWAV
jgi:hypothetical protein